MGPRKFLALSGLATIAVVLNHAAGWGFTAMFWWAHRFRPVVSPNFDQLGSLPYWGLSIVKNLTLFSVPTFFFISGFFVAYASRGPGSKYTWKMARVRVINLLFPYLIWSFIVFLMDYYINRTLYSPPTYLMYLLMGRATPVYWFVPLLIQYYLLAPFLVSMAKTHWKLLLLISAILQGFTQFYWYMRKGFLPAASILTGSKLVEFLFQDSGIFFFVLGIVAGLFLEEFKIFINKSKWVFLFVLVISAILCIVEYQAQVVTETSLWSGDFRTSFQFFFALSFIICYLASDKIPTFQMNNLIMIGRRSYGIFFIHVIVIISVAKILYHIAPWIFGYQSLYVLLLVVAGTGLPYIFMELFSRTPVRIYYKILFG